MAHHVKTIARSLRQTTHLHNKDKEFLKDKTMQNNQFYPKAITYKIRKYDEPIHTYTAQHGLVEGTLIKKQEIWILIPVLQLAEQS